MGEQIAAAGVEWLTALLTMQGVTTTVNASFQDDEAGSSCWLTIDDVPLTSEQVEGLIGDSGIVLDSIQYLANTTLNLGKSEAEQQAFTIELAGYRARRLEELKALAAEAADQVLTSREEYELKGLSSAERRQVHHFLSHHEGLTTFSRGREPDRRLVVGLASQQESSQ
jgi:spoIIIJ-associated protein